MKSTTLQHKFQKPILNSVGFSRFLLQISRQSHENCPVPAIYRLSGPSSVPTVATALRQGPVQRGQVLRINALRVVAEDLDPGALRGVTRTHGEPETAREVTDGQQNDEHLAVLR